MPPPMTPEELKAKMDEFAEYYPEEHPYAKRFEYFNDVFTTAIQSGDPSKSYDDLVAEYAANTYPILDHSVVDLIKNFLFFKSRENQQDRVFYIKKYPELADVASADAINKETVQKFVTRLLEKRPLVFYTKYDRTTDRPDVTNPGDKLNKGLGSYIQLSTTERINPTDAYISYEEMQIAALLQVSSPSLFINDGARDNFGGYKSGNSDFIPQGIIIGSVGARFEDPPGAGHMEYQHMLVTNIQNTAENGYGAAATPEQKAHLAHWAKFYGVGYFPTYEEVKDIYEKENSPDNPPENPQSYIKIGSGEKPLYLNVAVYKARMRKVIEGFLIEANARATADKPAYVHAVGLGMGVWSIAQMKQESLLLEVYAEVLKDHTFPHIADLDFSYFRLKQFNGKDATEGMQELLKEGPNKQIKIFFSNNNPSGYSVVKDKEYLKNKTLVVQYAWDGGSFAGNEYWLGQLAASGDPAAACASQIAELHNPLINPQFAQKCMITAGNQLEELHPSRELKADEAPPGAATGGEELGERPVSRRSVVTPRSAAGSTLGSTVVSRLDSSGVVARRMSAIAKGWPSSKATLSQVSSFKHNDSKNGGIVLVFSSIDAAENFAKNIPVKSINNNSDKKPYNLKDGDGFGLNFTTEQTYELMAHLFAEAEGDVLTFNSPEAAANFAEIISKLNPGLNKEPVTDPITNKSSVNFTSEERKKLCGVVTNLEPVASFFPSKRYPNGMILAFASEEEAKKFAEHNKISSDDNKLFAHSTGKWWYLSVTKEETDRLMTDLFVQGKDLTFKSPQAAQAFAAVIPVKQVDSTQNKKPYENKVTDHKSTLGFNYAQKQKLCGIVTDLNSVKSFGSVVDENDVKKGVKLFFDSDQVAKNFSTFAFEILQKELGVEKKHPQDQECYLSLTIEDTKRLMTHLFAQGKNLTFKDDKAAKHFAAIIPPLLVGRLNIEVKTNPITSQNSLEFTPEQKAKFFGIITDLNQVASFFPSRRYQDGGMILAFASEKEAKDFAAKNGIKSDKNKLFPHSSKKWFYLNLTKEENERLMTRLFSQGDNLTFKSKKAAQAFTKVVLKKDESDLTTEIKVDPVTNQYSTEVAMEQKLQLCGITTKFENAKQILEKNKFLNDDSRKNRLEDLINLLAYTWGQEVDSPDKKEYIKLKQQFIQQYPNFQDQKKLEQIFDHAAREYMIDLINTYDEKIAKIYQQASEVLGVNQMLLSGDESCRQIMLAFTNFLKEVRKNESNRGAPKGLAQQFVDKLHSEFQHNLPEKIRTGFEKIMTIILKTSEDKGMIRPG